MMHLFVYLLIACLLATFIGCTLLCPMEQRAAMQPIDPLVRSTGVLEINCTISDPESGMRADDLYFEWGRTRISDASTTVINNYTLQLQLANPSKNMSGVYMYCLHKTQGCLTSEYITIADSPVLESIRCKVIDWGPMECSWTPADPNTGIPTTTTLLWDYGYELNTARKCPCEERQGTCTFYRYKYPTVSKCSGILQKEQMLKIGFMYHILVIANNSLGETRLTWSGRPQDHVEPAKVTNMHIVNIGSRGMSIKWEHLVFNKDYLFRVSLQGKDGSKQVLNTTSWNATWIGLQPYTLYTIDIICIPIVRGKVTGYWSQPASVSYTTTSEVPSKHPDVTTGSFTTFYSEKNKRDIWIYWKLLSPEEKNAAIIQYSVHYECCETSKTKTVADDVNCYHFEDLPSRCYCTFTVYAKNNNFSPSYNTSLIPTVISVPTVGAHNPKRVDVLLMSSPTRNVSHTWDVLVVWDRVPGATGFTVYWCKGSSHSHSCQSELRWEHVSANVTETLLGLKERYDAYVFAVSAEWQADDRPYSSGMTWSSCTHIANDKPGIPSNLNAAPNEDSKSVTLEWDSHQCGIGGYIAYYVVEYWLDKAEHEKHLLNVSSANASMTITPLAPLQMYKVRMRTVGLRGLQSPWTEELDFSINGLSDGQIAGIAVGAAVTLLLVLLGILSLATKFRKRFREYSIVDITVPERPPEILTIPTETEDDIYSPPSLELFQVQETDLDQMLKNEDYIADSGRGSETSIRHSPDMDPFNLSMDSYRRHAPQGSTKHDHNRNLTNLESEPHGDIDSHDSGESTQSKNCHSSSMNSSASEIDPYTTMALPPDSECYVINDDNPDAETAELDNVFTEDFSPLVDNEDTDCRTSPRELVFVPVAGGYRQISMEES